MPSRYTFTDYSPAWPAAFNQEAERLALYAVVLRSRELTADAGRCQELVDAALEWTHGFELLLTW